MAVQARNPGHACVSTPPSTQDMLRQYSASRVGHNDPCNKSHEMVTSLGVSGAV